MDAIYQGIIALVTATGIAVAAITGGAVGQVDEPKQDKSVVVTVCGSGGLVPPNAETNCDKED